MSIDLQKSSTFATLALLSFVVSIIPRTSEALEDPRQALVRHQAAPTSCEAIYYGIFADATTVLQHYQSPEGRIALLPESREQSHEAALEETKRRLFEIATLSPRQRERLVSSAGWDENLIRQLPLYLHGRYYPDWPEGLTIPEDPWTCVGNFESQCNSWSFKAPGWPEPTQPLFSILGHARSMEFAYRLIAFPRQERLSELFELSRSLFTREILRTNRTGLSRNIRREWAQRLARSSFVFDEIETAGSGAFMINRRGGEYNDLRYTHYPDRALLLGRDYTGYPIYRSFRNQGWFHAGSQRYWATSIDQLYVNWQFMRDPETTSDAAHVFTLGHEFSHILDTVPDRVASCLSSPESIGATPRIADDTSATTADEAFNFNSGSGTELISQVDALVNKGQFDEARVLLERNNPIQQVTESLADVLGTEVVVRFIEQTYSTPELRRQAAMGVLASLRPHYYDAEAAEIMNRAGSKQTNERRALRIVLANPKFRSLIGCSFSAPITYCLTEPSGSR